MDVTDPVAWYEANATQYSETNPDFPIRKWLEWPGVRSLLSELGGKRVLDAGCGDGTFTYEIARMGGDVLGVDASRELLAIAKAQYGDEIEVRRADLREPIVSIADESIDVVVSQLVLDHVEDWGPVFAEFHRVLAPGGAVVLSVHNPCTVWMKLEVDESGRFGLDAPSYFETERWTEEWGSEDDSGPRRVQKFRKPLTAQVNAALDAGFVLDGFNEPRPTEEFEREQPARAERWSRRPSTFVCYRFRKLAVESTSERR